MEIMLEEDGLLLLNEVDLEEYLKRVVPSEMPSTYELEALKAQAGLRQNLRLAADSQGSAYSEYGAHVDDSTNFQVYNNTETFDSTNAAVNETFGQLLAYEGERPSRLFTIPRLPDMGRTEAFGARDASATPYPLESGFHQ